MVLAADSQAVALVEDSQVVVALAEALAVAEASAEAARCKETKRRHSFGGDVFFL